ncbi:uncharacterized protein PG998_009741 [Apiospora kogelbergensis]|uniref:Uncharacterized protein n=1 Tax=Apiospora kogelbergensis TaxID=1337665 RepID=A0AAW0R8I2_9PEZI
MNDESCYTGMRKRKDCEETDEKTWQEAGQKSIKSVRLYHGPLDPLQPAPTAPQSPIFCLAVIVGEQSLGHV